MIRALLPLLVAAVVPSGGPSDAAVGAARAHRAAHGPAVLRELAELLRLPNVADDLEDQRRNALHIVASFARRGVSLEAVELDGVPPVVVGRLDVPGATRTLGMYVHYDGQPVQTEAWTFDPWTPTLTTAALEDGGTARPLPADGEPIDPEWRLYGRASSDDKAPLIAMLAALDALDGAGLAPTSNLLFFFEGEEEAGSPNLGRYLETLRDRLDVDAWLICDGPVHQSRTPQLVFGVRGVTGVEITVYGAARSLHSGHYGNWAPNPGHRLARLLASMKDDDGRVLVEGFYDTVAPLTDQERAAIARVPDVETALKHELGLAESEGGGTLAERLLLPSLNVRGLDSAEVGERARNVIPASATAALDLRLVEGNDPVAMVDLVEAHVREQGYHVVREEPGLELRREHPRIARIVRGGGYRAARTPMDHPFVADLVAAAERALPEGEEQVVLTPSLGGSLPLYLFQEQGDGDTPIAIVPLANHDNNQHAPDENLRIANLWYGIDLMASLFTMP